jgi:hypothetical protein
VTDEILTMHAPCHKISHTAFALANSELDQRGGQIKGFFRTDFLALYKRHASAAAEFYAKKTRP